jgi:Fe(3+) dicitrate transport protein
MSVTYQFSYTSEQFTDATNAITTSNAVGGLVPAYWVMDLSASYTWKFLKLETGVNNLTDNRYFTRRATGYPGPGIMPADARNFYVSLQAKF